MITVKGLDLIVKWAECVANAHITVLLQRENVKVKMNGPDR